MTKPKVIAILGPTAVGKSRFALWLATHIDGEIVSADSRQVYRQMDIGTDKPSPEERSAVPHHLIDISDPDETITAAEFRRLAQQAINRVISRGKVPILVGGTNLYIKVTLEGWEIPPVPPDKDLRNQLEDKLKREGLEALVKELLARDPSAAELVDLRNPRRVVRALEVVLLSGRPLKDMRRMGPRPYQVLKIGLTAPRHELYCRIDQRIHRQLSEGLVEEVKRLLAQGYSPSLPSMSGLGYRQLTPYVLGKATLEACVRRLKSDTHRYARQQMSWLKRDPEIHWFDTTRPGWQDAALDLVRRFLSDPQTSAV